jgi:hypothetical protein
MKRPAQRVYRPRTLRCLALLAALPATVPQLIAQGFPDVWLRNKLLKLQSVRQVTRRFLTWHAVAEIQPTYGLRCCELLRNGPMSATELAASGDIPTARVHATLAQLELRGVVEVDAVARPLRYRLAVAP